jgi:hypothetical protein
MRLLREVRVSGFRSIEDQTLSGISDFHAIVGKNSSGKSNILRALNLFFNGEVEPGKTIAFQRDYFEQRPPSKKKKRISVDGLFAIPPRLKYRNELSGLDAFGKQFTIRRSWVLDERRLPHDEFEVTNDSGPVPNGTALARQFWLSETWCG